MKIETAVTFAMIGALCAMGISVMTVVVFGSMILTNQDVAWCGVHIAMGKKSHPSECQGVME